MTPHAAGLPFSRFDTRAVPPRDQFGAYLAAMETSPYEVVPHGTGTPAAFDARATLWGLGPMVLNSFESQAQTLRRTGRRQRSDGFDYYIVALSKSFAWQAEAGSRHLDAGRLVPYLLDLARPFEMIQTAPGASIILGIPRNMLDSVLPAKIECHGMRVDGDVGSLFADFLRGLEARLPAIEAMQARNLAQAACNLLAACLRPTQDRLERAHEEIESARMQRILRRIDINLHDPSLGPETLATSLKMSRSALYRLFEPHGGVAAVIQIRRLRAAHRTLTDAASPPRIADVARICGFTDAGHFSRAFRRLYGYPPRDARPAAAPVSSGSFGDEVGVMLRDWARQA